MADYRTPGVYIEEKNAFPSSVVAVETAVPAFIGYTEKAEWNGKSLIGVPTKVTSFSDYMEMFGGGYKHRYTISPVNTAGPETFAIQDKQYNVQAVNSFRLYNALRLFYSNGGADCFIVSVGLYSGGFYQSKLSSDNVWTALEKEFEPTLVVIPDAVEAYKNDNPGDFYGIYSKVLQHCQHVQSRFGIFDVPINAGEKDQANVDKFRDNIGTNFLNYGAAYYPWLNTSIVQSNEVNFMNLASAPDKEDTKTADKPETPSPDAAPQKNTKDAAKKGEVSPTPTPNNGNTGDKKDAKSLINDMLAAVNVLDKTLPEDAAKKLIANQKGFYSAVKFKMTNPTYVTPEPSQTAESGAGTTDTKDKAGESDGKITDPKSDITDKVGQALYDNCKDQKSIDDLATMTTAIWYVMQNRLDSDTVGQAAFTKLDGTKNAIPTKNLQSLAVAAAAKPDAFFDAHQTNVNFHQGLCATSPTYVSIMNEVRAQLNKMPPSAAMAGIYTMVDNSRGVWKAPANVSLSMVNTPTSNITHDEQASFNVDPLSGKSINIISPFRGIGTLVWGARTLDGNSQDWRYINVRRTLIMLEQSIKLAMRAYVFEPNTSSTWITVQSTISNFLTNMWKQGALAGSTPDQAFVVQVGLGVTMTPNDILDGKMLVNVMVAISRPAEFIVLTFQQMQQQS